MKTIYQLGMTLCFVLCFGSQVLGQCVNTAFCSTCVSGSAVNCSEDVGIQIDLIPSYSATPDKIIFTRNGTVESLVFPDFSYDSADNIISFTLLGQTATNTIVIDSILQIGVDTCTEMAFIFYYDIVQPTIDMISHTCNLDGTGDLEISATASSGGTLMFSIGAGFQSGSTFASVDAGLTNVMVREDFGSGFFCEVTSDHNIDCVGICPIVSAGADDEICADESYTLSGMITNGGMGFMWSGGMGSFDDASILDATYTPDPADGSSVMLTLSIPDPDGGGGCMESTSSMTLSINPLPVIAGDPMQEKCSGIDVVINIDVSMGTPGYTYSWTTSGGSFVDATIEDPIFVQNTPASNMLSVEVTDSKFCSETGVITVVTNALPATPVPANNNVEICFGDPNQTLSVTLTGANVTADWRDQNNTTVATNTTTYTPTITNIGDHTYRVVARNTMTTCVSADFAEISYEIRNLPVINNITHTCNTDGTGEVTIFANQVAAGALSYSIDGGAFQSQNTFSSVSPGTVSITVRETVSGSTMCETMQDYTFDCTSTCPIVSAGGDGEICSGDTYQLAGTVTNGGTGFMWSGGQGSFDNASSLNASYTPVFADGNTVELTLSIPDPDGSGGCMANSSSMTLTINPLPVIAGDPTQDICLGEELQVNIDVSSGSGGYTYNWTATSGSFVDNIVEDPIFSQNTIGTSTLSVVVTDNESCSQTGNITVTVNSLPEPIIEGDLEVCYQEPSSVEVMGSYVDYSWSDGGSNTPDRQLSGGDYTVTVTNSEGCTGTSSIQIEEFFSVEIQQCDGGDLFYYSDQGPYTISWPGGSTNTAAETYSISGLAAGNYIVTVTDAYGCTDECQFTITETSCLHPDIPSLLTFFNAMGGDRWQRKTGWEEAAVGDNCEPCSANKPWEGITCVNNRVVSIFHNNNNLNGSLPILPGLDSLKSLTIRDEERSLGELPNYRNPRLEQLNFINNDSLSGRVPNFDLPLLNELILNDNDLSGQIPLLENCINLEVIHLSKNSLDGAIPAFQQISLQEILFNSNLLSQEIPVITSPALTSFEAFGNNLSGCYPTTSYCNISSYNFSENPLLPYAGDYDQYCGTGIQEDVFCGSNQDSIILNCICTSRPCEPILLSLTSLSDTICLDDTSPFRISSMVSPPINGEGMYSGNGIGALTGIIDKSAIAAGQLSYTYTFLYQEDACLDSASIGLVVIDTCNVICAESVFIDPPTDITITCDVVDTIATQLFYTNYESGLCADNGLVDAVISGNYDGCGGQLVYEFTYQNPNGMTLNDIQNINVTPSSLLLEIDAPDDFSTIDIADIPSLDNVNYSNNQLGQCELFGNVSGTITPTQYMEGDTVTYTYEINAGCVDTIVKRSYIVASCPLISVILSGPDSLCLDSLPASLTLKLTQDPQRTGDSTFTGPFLIGQNGEIDVTQLVIGIHSYNYTFVDEASQCTFSSQWSITVYDCGDECSTSFAFVGILPDMSSQIITCNEASMVTFPDITYSNGDIGSCLIEGSVNPEITQNFNSCGGEITASWSLGDTLVHETYLTVSPDTNFIFNLPPNDTTVDCSLDLFSLLGYYTNEFVGDCNLKGTMIPNWSGEYDCGDTITLQYGFINPCGGSRTLSRSIILRPCPNPMWIDAPVSRSIECSEIEMLSEDLAYDNLSTDCPFSGSVNATILSDYDDCGGSLTYTWNYRLPDNSSLDHIVTYTINALNDPQWVDLPATELEIDCKSVDDYLVPLSYSNNSTNPCLIDGLAYPIIANENYECGDTVVVNWSYIDLCGRELLFSQKLKSSNCLSLNLKNDSIYVSIQNQASLDLYQIQEIETILSAQIISIDSEIDYDILIEETTLLIDIKEAFYKSINIEIEICDEECGLCEIFILKVYNEALKDIIQTNFIQKNSSTFNKLTFNNEDIIPNSKLWIFNRWGDKIYYTENYDNQWTANDYPTGIYYYVLRINNVDIKQTFTIFD